jgi:uncharacterized membrane protein YczE
MVQAAIIATISGWCWFLYSTYAFYDPGSVLKFTIAAGIICISLILGKNWARVIALLASVIIILYCGFFTFLFLDKHPTAMLVSAANVGISAAAFCFLIHPVTAAHFKSKAADGGSGDSGNKSSGARS